MKVDVDRKDKNKSQNDWRRRKARGKILAEAPLSIGVQRMLIEDDHVAAEVANARACLRLEQSGQSRILARGGLSAYDPKRT
jgi:hypothetical protein